MELLDRLTNKEGKYVLKLKFNLDKQIKNIIKMRRRVPGCTGGYSFSKSKEI